MIKIENIDVYGWEAAIRGMRNPMNSWDKSDSGYHNCNYYYACCDCPASHDDELCDKILEYKNFYIIGDNDLKLMKNLSKAGNDHAKFLRMINVTLDITAPLYWWKEFDTYKVGTVANSCSTMHKIHSKEFTLDDFSTDHLDDISLGVLNIIIENLNFSRKALIGEYEDIKKGDKNWWWQMIQLLPSSYNQKRTVQLNYQVLKSMYHARKNHKLDEWVEFCKWCEILPYFKEICIE